MEPVGDNTGLAIAGLLTPVVGDQEKVVALLVVFVLNDPPKQILAILSVLVMLPDLGLLSTGPLQLPMYGISHIILM